MGDDGGDSLISPLALLSSWVMIMFNSTGFNTYIFEDDVCIDLTGDTKEALFNDGAELLKDDGDAEVAELAGEDEEVEDDEEDEDEANDAVFEGEERGDIDITLISLQNFIKPVWARMEGSLGLPLNE